MLCAVSLWYRHPITSSPDAGASMQSHAAYNATLACIVHRLRLVLSESPGENNIDADSAAAHHQREQLGIDGAAGALRRVRNGNQGSSRCLHALRRCTARSVRTHPALYPFHTTSAATQTLHMVDSLWRIAMVASNLKLRGCLVDLAEELHTTRFTVGGAKADRRDSHQHEQARGVECCSVLVPWLSLL